MTMPMAVSVVVTLSIPLHRMPISSLYYILDPFLFMSGIVVTALMS